MVSNIRNILTFIFFLSVFQTHADQIWYEQFLIPNKGIWGDEDGQTIHSDFSGIENWHLEFENISLFSPDEYAKTVSTSGGRFEVRNVEGEIKWRSEWINIKNFSNISIRLTAYETGSATNENYKYLKAYFRLDGGEENFFYSNGINAGNWGSAVVEQTGLIGDSLQIVVYMSNFYSVDKVTLDEILVSGDVGIGDTIPPFISDVKTQSADTLAVYFNEPINPENLKKEDFSLFSDKKELSVLSVTKIESNFIILTIDPSQDVHLTLIGSGISDFSGNTTEIDSFSFLYLPPVHQFDVVLNEIMADPSPPQGLPEFEFIELFNRAVFPVSLKNWKLKVDGIEKPVEDWILLPGEFLILTSTGGLDDFSKYGKVMAVKGFPTIRNKGAMIELVSEIGVLIDQINYSSDWPLNPDKSDGGWSVERIDPNRFCGQANNWRFSENESGGSPGSENSVHQNNADNQSPTVWKVEAQTATCLELEFSESMDTILLNDKLNFSVSDGMNYPGSISFISSKLVTLYFSGSFSEDKTYTLSFKNLTDECGNNLEETDVSFTWSVARPGDIVINEVLSNPYPEGTDFIEFYNNSEKILHIDHLWFSNGNDTIALVPATNEEVVMKPESYLVCTKDSAKVVQPYFSSCLQNIFTINGFPAIYNDEGSVILMNQDFEVIDRFDYSGHLYSPVLNEIEGVSLERISFNSETNDPANWQTAAESYGYATPGCENSQTGKGFVNSVVFEPESFSPNLDGYNDEYRISYQLGKSGCVANVWVFDVSGRLVFQLAKNEILATEGSITWNGKDGIGQKLPLGVYVIVVEIFDLCGKITRFKDAVVLTDIME